ncbi:lysM domain receptor-like kinase 3 [Selaginella moellendorffii]|nr:lysM domain receptor-like kinase 3 [Selaginella moellendorffii]|eukprot:XP_002974347.2 lysM domain receptor-like kinase 3 [Selaginella moellendorffii]
MKSRRGNLGARGGRQQILQIHHQISQFPMISCRFGARIHLGLLLLASSIAIGTAQLANPLNCSDPARTCSAFLHYMLPVDQSLQDVESMFDVWPPAIAIDNNTMFAPSSSNQTSIFVKITCGCSSSSRLYGYTVRIPSPPRDFQGLEWKEAQNNTAPGYSWLLCGCSSNTYPYLVSHVVQNKDTLALLALRYGTNGSDISQLNHIDGNGAFLASGVVYYIPVTTPPGSTEAIAPGLDGGAQEQPVFGGKRRKSRLPLGAVVGIAGSGALVIALALGCAIYSARRCFLREPKEFPVAKTPAFSKELMSKVTNVEKPLVFSYEEIEAATDCFKESKKLGQGAYGSVFHGNLRNQEVAVKRMKATKAKEFMVEIQVLCKAHHFNLVELIGYASCDEELFLVYEFAENRSLSDRLHEPLSKGYTPLSWVTRVQIALDAARGLEYIHDHTKQHYLHRDIKSSNILLDGSFRAKIADFGLAKLIEQGEENGILTRIVGTFGYLAPEYMRNGHATTKSDVYSFGVVLFELITGQEAISKSRLHIPSTPERRSLISVMLSALKDATPVSIGRLRDVADPTLDNTYPSECLHKVSVLGKQCVEEDPLLRPDMKQVVFTLSHVLFNSIEWEATLAGNSQVFSGIMQGR